MSCHWRYRSVNFSLCEQRHHATTSLANLAQNTTGASCGGDNGWCWLAYWWYSRWLSKPDNYETAPLFSRTESYRAGVELDTTTPSSEQMLPGIRRYRWSMHHGLEPLQKWHWAGHGYVFKKLGITDQNLRWMLLVLISVVLNSTVARWGSRSSPSETGMTFSLLLNYASSHMGVKSDCYASGITQLAEREPWMASWMPATGTYH